MSDAARREGHDVERYETEDPPRSSSSVLSSEGDSSLVLRIKRKRGDEPISALRIESLLSNAIYAGKEGQHNRGNAVQDVSGDGLSIASSGRKRRLTDRGIFRLAETVSISSFTDAKATRQLEQRIKDRRLDPAIIPKAPVREAPLERAEADGVVKTPSSLAKEGSSSSSSNDASAQSFTSALRFKIVKPVGKTRSGLNSSVTSLKSKDSNSSLRTRALSGKHARTASRGSLAAATKTHTKSPLASRVRFVDAVMESPAGERGLVKGGKGSEKKKSSLRKEAPTTDDDVEMNALDRRFADLLGNYLIENDLEPPKDLYDSTAQKESREDSDSSSAAEDVSEDDYVYDIYYREKETNWGSGPAGAADAGLHPAEVAGREVSGPPSIKEAGPTIAPETQFTGEPMATLVGFNEEDDLISEMESATKLMAQEVPGDSEDDFDEGEDEDSNDEGFYRNDYPEDEGADEDELDQSAWGWSGPRRRAQRSSSGDESEGEEDEESDYE